MHIVLATNNIKKLKEIKRIVSDLDITLHTLNEFPGFFMPPETENTFEGNALIKARAVFGHSGMASLADDSGLVVDALGCEPGVYSARYAGDGASDEQNLNKVLKGLQGTPDIKRTARFVCAIALITEDGKEHVFKGEVEGMITEKPVGKSGFGYDPVFVPMGFKITFAEMSPDQKDGLSHRGRALGGLRAFLIKSHI